jgi:RNA polymerase sigma-70 factor (ECF subfamily)
MRQSADWVILTYGSAVARIAGAYERDASLREELVQDMLLAIVTALPRLHDASKLRAYIFRIAHNRATRHVISRMRDPAVVADIGDLADEVPDQEQALIASERQVGLMDAVRRLPLPYRQVITLMLEDLSYAEIGEALGLSQSNVGVRINRAKQLLRKALQNEG